MDTNKADVKMALRDLLENIIQLLEQFEDDAVDEFLEENSEKLYSKIDTIDKTVEAVITGHKSGFIHVPASKLIIMGLKKLLDAKVDFGKVFSILQIFNKTEEDKE